MELDKNTKEYAQKLKAVKLSAASRTRLKERLGEYADFHAVSESVRVSTADRSRTQVFQTSTTVWYATFFKRIKRSTMPLLVIAVVLVLGGGTTFAAEGSLPGDLLYPVKVGFNESVRAALAVSADSEAKLQADLLEERVHEAEELKAEGRLQGELAMEVGAGIRAQAKAADKASDQTEATVAVATDNRIELALAHYDRLTGTVRPTGTGGGGTGTSVALATTPTTRAKVGVAAPEMDSAAAVSDVTVSTMVALEPISIEQLSRNNEQRLEAVRSLLVRHQNDIQADVRAELEASIHDIDQLNLQVMLQSNLDIAHRLMLEISDMLAHIEATLTSLGKAKIDTETGALLDVDFSQPPVYDEEPGMLPMPPTIDPLPMDGQTSGGGGADSAVDITSDMIDVSTETQTNFSF